MKKPDYKWRLLSFLFGAFYFAGGAFPVVQFDWADQDAGKTPDL